ncbi:MAG: metallophosphatase domain-containing protein [Cytophagaceae bacterium]
MKFVTISDTHGYHSQLILPPADAIIHAGDITKSGTKEEVLDFISWFGALDYQYKIFIPGNHDYYLEKCSPEELKSLLPKNTYLLNDSGITINNIKIWGSPVQPCYHNMAFNRERGEEIKRHWDLIPEDTDILITHGPPFGILDENCETENVGCKDILKKVLNFKPKYYVFGHIHEAYGMTCKDGVCFINACVLDRNYKIINFPTVIKYLPLESPSDKYYSYLNNSH